jgi:hypothetical protein
LATAGGLVFTLGAKTALPPTQPCTPPPLNSPMDAQPADLVASGRQGYSQFVPPGSVMSAMIAITMLPVFVVEVARRRFCRIPT